MIRKIIRVFLFLLCVLLDLEVSRGSTGGPKESSESPISDRLNVTSSEKREKKNDNEANQELSST